ncbi:hypothetical protein KO02_07970 [Sphingobacterium sp. ML3W]|uniref:polysaccharide deacetylase family protein n=1 Tax=Sphingobacterium sp. ML3W TaxID=1538644 RepID=UPI0004F7C024|nr:polysaccharide deacetylase family protein [Sphingobacterium sp. ML3W]AIM36651.1 hypothetical protein KO02_07970 [Sphingobacterium sp. ML3W]
MKKAFNLGLILGLLSISSFALQSCNEGAKGKSGSIQNDTVVNTAVIDKLGADKVEKKIIDDSIAVKNKKTVLHHAVDTSKLLTDSVSPRYIYLTFDDGPLNGSQFIDSIATAKNVKINTFLIGKHDRMSKGLHKYYERYINNPLVDCYNHSFTHAHNKFTEFYSNAESSFEDFDKNEKELNLQHKIVRLPGRNIWYFADRKRIDMESGSSTADMLYQNGYRTMGWDCEWKKGKPSGIPKESVSFMYRQINNRLRNGTSFSKNNVVLLMHDDMFQTRKGQQMLSDLIDSLKSHPNYEFAHMRDYPKQK